MLKSKNFLGSQTKLASKRRQRAGLAVSLLLAHLIVFQFEIPALAQQTESPLQIKARKAKEAAQNAEQAKAESDAKRLAAEEELRQLKAELAREKSKKKAENNTGEKKLADVKISVKAIDVNSTNTALKSFRDIFIMSTEFGPEMIWLPSGSFDMGSKDGVGESYESPLRKDVQVTAFAIAKTEVTVQQYLSCVHDLACDEPQWREKDSNNHYQSGSNNYYSEFGGALYAEQSPIVGVSWVNTQQYVKWLSTKTGQSYRVPSESEWEYACKAGKETTYCGGDDVVQVAWTIERSGGKIHAVASLTNGANAWGLLDMSGNVREWTQDCWHSDYKDAPKEGGVWAGGNCSYNTVRGGSWRSDPWYARAAIRYVLVPGVRTNDLGFRVARTAR